MTRTLTIKIEIPDDERCYQHAVAYILLFHALELKRYNVNSSGTRIYRDCKLEWEFV